MPSKEGRTWRGVVWIDGRRESQKRGFKRKSDARAWERAEKKRLIANAERRRRGTDLLTLCTKYLDFAEKFSKSVYLNKRRICRRILKQWGPDILVEEITAEMAEQYLQKQAKERTASEANKDLQNLRAMWNKGIKTYGIMQNPFAEIEKFAHDRVPQYTPPPEDVLRVLMVATREERVFLEAFLQTGARRSEILRWNWIDDINFEACQVRLGTRKTKDGSMEYEWIPMSSELYKHLKWLWENRKFKHSPYVFVNIYPRHRHYGKPYTLRSTFMPRLCERAGVKPFGYHALRRFVASYLVDKGKSLKIIQRVMRHKNLATTELYVHLLNRDLIEVYEGLSIENHPKAPPQEGGADVVSES